MEKIGIGIVNIYNQETTPIQHACLKVVENLNSLFDCPDIVRSADDWSVTSINSIEFNIFISDTTVNIIIVIKARLNCRKG